MHEYSTKHASGALTFLQEPRIIHQAGKEFPFPKDLREVFATIEEAACALYLKPT